MEGIEYRIEDDVELLADRYARVTASNPHSTEPALLTKKQVAALLRDAYTAGYSRATSEA